MKLTESSVSNFTEQLASKSSVPGGGGASALVGAVGIALGDMVGEFTVGKKKYADVEDEIREMMHHAQDLRIRLLECIEKDAEAFEPLSKAYGIPKDDPSRDEEMEKCLLAAAAAPMEILELCGEAIDLLNAFGKKGSIMVISDAATGVMFCQSAMYGAAVNVKVNTKSMKNRVTAEDMNRKADMLLAEYIKKADAVYREICGRIC